MLMQKNKPSIFSNAALGPRCAMNPIVVRIITLFARIVRTNQALLSTKRDNVVVAVE